MRVKGRARKTLFIAITGLIVVILERFAAQRKSTHAKTIRVRSLVRSSLRLRASVARHPIATVAMAGGFSA